MKLWLSLICAFLAGAVQAACLLFADAAQAAPVRIVTPSLPDSRGNPHTYIGLPFGLVNQAVFEPLVRIGAGGVAEPVLAESWTQETPTRWVFKLRGGVTFSNGEPFDAAAVVAALNYVLGTPLPSDMLASVTMRAKIAAVTARDPLTVQIDTKVIDPILPVHLFNVQVPAPQAWAKGIAAFVSAPVGTGPYRVTKWAPGSVMLVANTSARTPGTVPEIEVRGMPDPTARALAIASGSADIALDVMAETASDGGFRLTPRLSTQITYMQFVTVGNAPFKDVRVRRALNYAVDRQKLIHTFLNDAVTPATQFTHPDAFGYNTTLAPYPYDPAKAKALLAEAGYDKGLTVPIAFVTGQGPDASIYQLVAADLAAVGVKVEFRALTMGVWLGHLNGGDWPGGGFITGIQGYDPVVAFNTRSCDWAKPHHCDRDLMPLLNAARSSTTADELRGRINTLMAYEHDNPPGLMLWQRTYFDGLGPRVTDYKVGRDRIDFTALRAK